MYIDNFRKLTKKFKTNNNNNKNDIINKIGRAHV